jgi:hypothetical protein
MPLPPSRGRHLLCPVPVQYYSVPAPTPAVSSASRPRSQQDSDAVPRRMPLRASATRPGRRDTSVLLGLTRAAARHTDRPRGESSTFTVLVVAATCGAGSSALAATGTGPPS